MFGEKIKGRIANWLAAATGLVVLCAILALSFGGWAFSTLSGHVASLNRLVVFETELANCSMVVADLELSGLLSVAGDLEQADQLSHAALAIQVVNESLGTESAVPGTAALRSELGELVNKAAAANAKVRANSRVAKDSSDVTGLKQFSQPLQRLLAVRQAVDLKVGHMSKIVQRQSNAARTEQKRAQSIGALAFVSGSILLLTGLVFGIVLHRTVAAQYHDLSELNEDLRDKKEFVESILDSLQANICIVNRDGVIVEVNHEWDRFRLGNGGKRANAGVGANYFEMCQKVQGEGRKAAISIFKSIKRVVEGELPSFDEEYAAHTESETKWYQIRVTPLRTEHFQGGVIAHIDVTERREAQESRERVYRELIESYQQAGKASSTVGALHNIGNGLNSINVSTNLLIERCRESASRRLGRAAKIIEENQDDLAEFLTTDPQGQQFPQFLRQLFVSIDRERDVCLEELDSLGRHVKNVTKIVAVQHEFLRGASTIEEIDVRSVVDDAIGTIQGSFERSGINVIREFSDVSRVKTCKEKLMQAVSNLTINALQAIRDHLGDEPTLTVRVLSTTVSEDDSEEGDFDAQEKQSDKQSGLRIEIEDTGVGISIDMLERIFEHGFSTREDSRGLGLPAAKNAINELGGLLSVTSSGPHRGAKFVIELPSEGQKKCYKKLLADVS